MIEATFSIRYDISYRLGLQYEDLYVLATL